ncbi:hypothetical protein C8Q76DRAFT_288297 [Earliella scabrosa]|nr:hypothetical protein C8Q76DRAFT_288297 [Earliella scabrosa]
MPPSVTVHGPASPNWGDGRDLRDGGPSCTAPRCHRDNRARCRPSAPCGALCWCSRLIPRRTSVRSARAAAGATYFLLLPRATLSESGLISRTRRYGSLRHPSAPPCDGRPTVWTKSPTAVWAVTFAH